MPVATVKPYKIISKRRIIMNAYLRSECSYCPPIWMCCSRADYSKINRLGEHFLRITYSDKTSSFKALLEKECPVSIHTRNLQLLAIEMYKTSKGQSPQIITEVLKKIEHYYNLRLSHTSCGLGLSWG